MKNLLFVAYRFPPDGGPAVQRPAKFAKYLPEFGYRPLVLTAADYGKKYALDWSLRNELGNISVTPCRGREGCWRLLRATGLAPLAKLFVLPDKERLWISSAVRAAQQLAQQHRIDALITTVAPRSCALLGARLRQLLGVPWILDYRDPWTTGARVWASPLHRWWEVRQERLAVAQADAVVVVTPTMKDLLIQAFPEARGKVHVICNGYDEQDFAGLAGSPPADRLRITYSGGFADYHPLRDGMTAAMVRMVSGNGVRDWSTYSPYYLLQAVRALLDEHPQWKERIELKFVGRFGKANAALVRSLGLDHVVSIEGYLPHAQSVGLLMQSDVLFLALYSLTNWPRHYILPGKLFEYLATGKPILAAVPEGDTRDVIRRARAGWCVDPHDVQAIQTLLAELVQQKQSGRLLVAPDRQYIQQFKRRDLTRQLAGLLDGLVGGASVGKLRRAG